MGGGLYPLPRTFRTLQKIPQIRCFSAEGERTTPHVTKRKHLLIVVPLPLPAHARLVGCIFYTEFVLQSTPRLSQYTSFFLPDHHFKMFCAEDITKIKVSSLNYP